MFESILMQVQSTSDIYSGTILAIAGLISAISGIIVHYVNQPKIKAVAELAQTSADKVVEGKSDLTAFAKVIYDMLPEQAKQIADAPDVRIAALETKLQQATTMINDLQAKAKEKVG